MSAAHVSAAETITAPCATYSASARPLPSPASRSTSTRCPRDTRLRTPAGVMPTRYSRVLISFGTPTITGDLLGQETALTKIAGGALGSRGRVRLGAPAPAFPVTAGHGSL